MRLKFDEMQQEIKRVFVKLGMSQEDAEICSRIHTETSNDGIYSHGTNRVARFVDYVKKGWVDLHATPSIENEFGAVMTLNGNMGPGILNALAATDHGMKLADQYGIGMVGLKNTTHWMRGGTYGLYAAKKGYAAIMWTNTESCMPPWGGKDCKLGNNPFVMAIPGEPAIVMLDMAMSQYAYGKLEVTRLAGKKLPFPGGFDTNGNLTDEPGPIEQSMRILPMGYWKGSSFSLILDLFAAVLSNGLCGSEIDAVGKGSCGGASQVFLVLKPEVNSSHSAISETIRKTIEHVKNSSLAENDSRILYPGEDYVSAREDHRKNGIFVEDKVWEEIIKL